MLQAIMLQSVNTIILGNGVYRHSHIKHTGTEFFSVKASGKYSNHCAFKG
jgi:hypothetical protein